MPSIWILMRVEHVKVVLGDYSLNYCSIDKIKFDTW
jgi:hypothetical protein